MSIADLADHTLLSASRERTLTRSAHSGDKQSREALLRHNIRLVLWAVAAMRPPHEYRDDLQSAGVIGLLEAIDRFDPNRGTRLATYALQHIRNALDEEFTRLKSPILIPLRERRVISKLQALESNAGVGDIKWGHDRPQAQPVASLDRLAGEGGSTPVGELIADPNVDVEASVVGGDDPTADRVGAALAHLNQVQRRVMELRFGIGSSEHTTDEAAATLGLTVEQTRWLEMQARRALRTQATTATGDVPLLSLIPSDRFTEVTDLARAAGEANTLGVEMRLYALAKRGVLERRHRGSTIEYRTCPANQPVLA